MLNDKSKKVRIGEDKMRYEVKFEDLIVEADNEEEARDKATQQVILGNLEIESMEPF